MAGEEKDRSEAPRISRGWDLVNLEAFKTPPVWFAASIYVVSTVILLTLIGFAIISTFQFSYESLVGTLSDRVDAAKVFFPVIVALIGGPILIWRTLTSHWAAQAARYQADTGREAHFTGLFTKAVEQLGATRDATKIVPKLLSNLDGEQMTVIETEPNLEVRLGAIYALERVARDSERDHWPIMEVLCAYVRNQQNSGAPKERPEDTPLPNQLSFSYSDKYLEWLLSIPEPRVDVQAVLTVLSRRPDARVLHEQAVGNTLNFLNATLQRASFRGNNFSRAIFFGSYLDRAMFRGAQLNETHFERSHLESADMTATRLYGCSFTGAKMTKVNLNHTIAHATVFPFAHLEAADFTFSNLTATNFYESKLADAHFENAVIKDADFEKADARRVDFTKANLQAVTFHQTTLYGAQFSSANLNNVSFSESRLNWSIFFDCDLSSAEGLSENQLSVALGDQSTILPSGLKRPPEWPSRVLNAEERSQFIAAAVEKTRFEI